MNQSTILIRVLSIIFFPLLLIFVTHFIENKVSNRQVLTQFDNVYEVSDPGVIRIDFVSKLMNDTVTVKSIEHLEPSTNTFLLEYTYQDTVVALYEVTVRSDHGAMNIVLDTSQSDGNTIGVIGYESSGNIGFVFEKRINETTIQPKIIVSIEPTKTQKYITVGVHILWILGVFLINLFHGIKAYRAHIFKAIQPFGFWDRIKYLLIGLLIPFGGPLLYIIGGTDLYNDYRVRMGNYAAFGFMVTFTLYVIVRTFPLI